MFHVAEEIVMPEYLRMAEFRDAVLIDENGVSQTVSFKRYNCYQSGVKRDLQKMGEYYESAGVVRHGLIGSSNCMLIRARDVIDISVDVIANRQEEFLSYDN